MRLSFFDPDARAREKAASRAEDDANLRAGRITRAQLGIRNEGYGLLRSSKLVLQKPKARPAPPDASPLPE